MSDEELLQLNQEGFIPGPQETEILFLERVKKTKEYFLAKSWIPRSHWDWAKLRVKDLFDFEPRWLPVFYSNQGLAPWEGAAAWIEGGSIQAIQLRQGLKKGRYLGLYDRDEILAHEAVHGARCAFEESGNEEWFAYLTSEKKWRRALGPILRRPGEIWPFLAAAIGGICCQWAAIYWENLELISKICFWIACFWIVLGFWRLIRHHQRLKLASKAALHWTGNSGRARALLFRLTDREIELFAKGADLKEYAEKQSCLRWKLIRLAYL